MPVHEVEERDPREHGSGPFPAPGVDRRSEPPGERVLAVHDALRGDPARRTDRDRLPEEVELRVADTRVRAVGQHDLIPVHGGVDRVLDRGEVA